MNKLIKIFSSRTNIAVLVMVLLGSVQYLENFMNPELYLLINSMLGALAVYFRINAQVDFNK